MNHKRAVRADKPLRHAKIGSDASGGHGPDIVDRQWRWNGAEKIIEPDAIRYAPSRRLEGQMDVGDVVAAGDGRRISDAGNGALINGACEDAVDFIRRLGRLGYGTFGHVVSLRKGLRQ